VSCGKKAFPIRLPACGPQLKLDNHIQFVVVFLRWFWRHTARATWPDSVTSSAITCLARGTLTIRGRLRCIAWVGPEGWSLTEPGGPPLHSVVLTRVTVMMFSFDPTTRTIAMFHDGELATDIVEVTINSTGFRFRRAGGEVFAAGEFALSAHTLATGSENFLARPDWRRPEVNETAQASTPSAAMTKVEHDVAAFFGGGK
jgi:hypothetical protein